MRILNKLILIGIVLVVQKSFGQQESNFSLYNFNMTLLNPAYAGATESEGLTAAFRRQWVGIPGGPKSVSASYSKSLPKNVGLGINVYNSSFAISNRTNLNVDVSYKVRLTENTNAYVGIKVGGSFLNVDYSQVITPSPDPNFTNKLTTFNTQLGFGFYVQNSTYYLNFSAPNFIKETIKNNPNYIAEKPNFYLGGGYHISLNENIILTPRFMMLFIGSYENSFDIGGSLNIRNKFTFGSNYRIDEMVTLYAMCKVIDKVTFGFSYDFITSDFSVSNSDGSLDLILKYHL